MTSGKVRFSGLGPFSDLWQVLSFGDKQIFKVTFSISFQKRSRNSIYCRCLFPMRWKVGNSRRGAKRTKFHVRESTRWRCNGRRERSRAIFQRKCKDYIELSQTDGELPSAARLKTLKTAANAKIAKVVQPLVFLRIMKKQVFVEKQFATIDIILPSCTMSRLYLSISGWS